jgi:hypothetical protein
MSFSKLNMLVVEVPKMGARKPRAVQLIDAPVKVWHADGRIYAEIGSIGFSFSRRDIKLEDWEMARSGIRLTSQLLPVKYSCLVLEENSKYGIMVGYDYLMFQTSHGATQLRYTPNSITALVDGMIKALTELAD